MFEEVIIVELERLSPVFLKQNESYNIVCW